MDNKYKSIDDRAEMLPPRGKARRRFLKDVTLGALEGLLVLIGISCATKSKYSRAKAYFENAYNKIDLSDITTEEKEIITHTNFLAIVPYDKEFIKQNFPYVNVENQTSKDKLFLKREESMIKLLQLYVNLENYEPTPKEIKLIEEWYKQHPSGKIEMGNNELARALSIFVDPNNMSGRDILFVNAVVNAYKYNGPKTN